MRHRKRIGLFVLALLATSCVEESQIFGTIQGSSFEVVSGSAESIDNQYVITLADTPEFTCDATRLPPDDYLTIVISDIDGLGTFDADGTVFFNSFEDRIGDGEPAERGSVVIDSISPESIEGSIDASGPNSSVAGEFVVDVCP